MIVATIVIAGIGALALLIEAAIGLKEDRYHYAAVLAIIQQAKH